MCFECLLVFLVVELDCLFEEAIWSSIAALLELLGVGGDVFPKGNGVVKTQLVVVSGKGLNKHSGFLLILRREVLVVP